MTISGVLHLTISQHAMRKQYKSQLGHFRAKSNVFSLVVLIPLPNSFNHKTATYRGGKCFQRFPQDSRS